MAKASVKAKDSAPSGKSTGQPKFPYATKPNSLRRFLELVPQKPKPPKINMDTLKAWGLRNTNDHTIIRVLKAMGFVASNNEPTERYTAFMSRDQGPGILATAIREVWAPMFQHSHEPHREIDATLRNYFNIHSGGSENTIALQIQTFKAVCDHADFTTQMEGAAASSPPSSQPIVKVSESATLGPGIHINVHIHLPENKSRRDYEYIFEDIARYIFGRDIAGRSDDKA